MDSVEQGAHSHCFLPEARKRYSDQLSVYKDSKTHCSGNLLHPYSSLHLLLLGHYSA